MTGGAYRRPDGGRIDRTQPLQFSFNGKSYLGFAGDTLASALMANGVTTVARSIKYHRPRGILSAGSHEPNALVQLENGADTEPNLRATQIELYDGLVAESVNVWPSLGFDLGVVTGLFSRLLVAGFYYKTFMWPARFWLKLYEPIIRRAAGFGVAPKSTDPDRYTKSHVATDVLIIGSGPAGLAAASAAARSGAGVILLDEQAELGGSLLDDTGIINGQAAELWRQQSLKELAENDAVRRLPRTTAFGYYDNNYICAVERCGDHLRPGQRHKAPRQRLWHIRAGQIILATGALERPLVFGNNDLPGIMLAGAVGTYVKRYGVRPGGRVVFFTNNDSAYEVALELLQAGLEVPAIIDARPTSSPELSDQVRQLGVEVLHNKVITRARGRGRIEKIEIMNLGPDGTGVRGATWTLDADLLAISGGWSPTVHLFSHAGGRLRFDAALACFRPQDAGQPNQHSVGACNGVFDLGDVLLEAWEAGRGAAKDLGHAATRAKAPRAETKEATPLRPIWLCPAPEPVGRGSAKPFVDFQADVTAADILLASREGMQSVEHMKRYTTTGMWTDQGKTSNVNALAILAASLDKQIPAVGTTTFRPPYTPVAFGVLAGREKYLLSDPLRTTPIQPWHREAGAKFEDVGQWQRPWYFPQKGEDIAAAVNRECLAVRQGVGVLDASTLGKIGIKGPDAAEFLNRIYTNAWAKLKVGGCRYGLMCGEDGMVFDDGVSARFAEDLFYMTTTTGGAARVLDWLEEYLQTEWPELRVYCTSLTEQWSTVSISGPKARHVMQALEPGQDWGAENFAFMTMQERQVAGIAAKVFRIGFTGELTYEINVPARFGLGMWRAVMAAGAAQSITPFGTEAMHVLRAEKGFIIAGQDTDGTVTPQDLGMDWIVSKKKPDFIGKRSFARPDNQRTNRKQLVGLITDDPKFVIDEGAQVVRRNDFTPPVPMIGHVTSSYYSAALGHSIALALIEGGREKHGQKVTTWSLDKSQPATIVEPIFYDKEGGRKDG